MARCQGLELADPAWLVLGFEALASSFAGCRSTLVSANPRSLLNERTAATAAQSVQ